MDGEQFDRLTQAWSERRSRRGALALLVGAVGLTRSVGAAAAPRRICNRRTCPGCCRRGRCRTGRRNGTCGRNGATCRRCQCCPTQPFGGLCKIDCCADAECAGGRVCRNRRCVNGSLVVGEVCDPNRPFACESGVCGCLPNDSRCDCRENPCLGTGGDCTQRGTQGCCDGACSGTGDPSAPALCHQCPPIWKACPAGCTPDEPCAECCMNWCWSDGTCF